MAKKIDDVRKTGWTLALLLFAGVAAAQTNSAGPAAPHGRPAAPAPAVQTAPAPTANAPAAQPVPAIPTPEKPPANVVKISYAGGLLTIDVLNSTLKDVLTKVSALTGVKFEIPDAANGEKLAVVKLGPGPAREILASLLYQSNFDYLILASAGDPQAIQDVVLMPPEKKTGGGKGPELAARASRPPQETAEAAPPKSEEIPEPVSPVTTAADNTPAAAPASSPTPAGPSAPLTNQPPLTSQSDSFGLSPAAISNRSGLTTEGAMNPPSDLSTPSINQQLLQMYQQTMQFTQQRRMTGQPPANTGSQ